MELLFRILLFITGAINVLPAILVFSSEKLSKSYGIEIPNPNFELLLRHRAVLFGIVGGLMLYAAILKKHYFLSVTVGLVSMVSFIVLYFSLEGINQNLEKVMRIDFIATALLIIVFAVYKIKSL